MRVAIFGGTGLVGSEVLKHLESSSMISQVYSIQRRDSDNKSHKVEEVIFSGLDIKHISDLNIEVDIVICCLGTTIKTAGSKEKFKRVDYELSLETALYAKRVNAKFILVSAAGADAKSFFFYNKVKGELEEAVKNLELKSLIIFRPSLLIGDREERRLAEGVAINSYRLVNKFLPIKVSKLLGTKVSALSQRIAEAALKTDDYERVFGTTEI